MSKRTISILNDSDFGSSVFCICTLLLIIWYVGEPDFGDAVLDWMTDGRITYVAPAVEAKPAPQPVPIRVPVPDAAELNNGTDPFAEGASDTNWLIKSVPVAVEPEPEGD